MSFLFRLPRLFCLLSLSSFLLFIIISVSLDLIYVSSCPLITCQNRQSAKIENVVMFTSAVSLSPPALAGARWSRRRYSSCFCDAERCFAEALCHRHMKCIRSPEMCEGDGSRRQSRSVDCSTSSMVGEREKTRIKCLLNDALPSRRPRVAAAERMESATAVCGFQSDGGGQRSSPVSFCVIPFYMENSAQSRMHR